MEQATGRFALVTGASAGIGLAFARELAARRANVILTARRRERLEALARTLRETYGVQAHVIVEDLADPNGAGRLVHALSNGRFNVDILINNAGYGVPGRYATTTWEQQRDFLQVMVVAVAELTHRLVPAMIDRRWGRVVNVASLAGLLPGVAGHTLYAASKSFVISFSESLALETARDGIHVTASCPGFTHSEFHDVTGTREHVHKLPKFMWSDAPTVARESLDAVMRGDAIYVPGRVNRSLAAAARVLPRWTVTRLMTRNADKFRRV
jgi:short-subunit dehydrogenase